MGNADGKLLSELRETLSLLEKAESKISVLSCRVSVLSGRALAFFDAIKSEDARLEALALIQSAGLDP